MTNNKDLKYIAECAESVGIHVDEHTAITIPFIADVMRKMREQSNSDGDYISFPKGTLKKRGKGYVVYNPEWLKENWQTELKAMGIEPSVQPKPKTDVFDKIRAEIHATAEMHEDGDYYLRDEWIDEIIDKYMAESEK